MPPSDISTLHRPEHLNFVATRVVVEVRVALQWVMTEPSPVDFGG
jgi:hypothetical protein